MPPIRILLVDDDFPCIEPLLMRLNLDGYEAEAATDPKTALRLFREAAEADKPFQIVITDFKMPVWSGLTLAMHIAEVCTVNQIKAPVICLTGNASDVRRMNERDRGPLAMVLEKGCTMADVENAIKCTLERNA